jgi:isopentenyl diphosphate isomerase/L-lactate dehydrogenase-like FMN-dependent dehydrogenase
LRWSPPQNAFIAAFAIKFSATSSVRRAVFLIHDGKGAATPHMDAVVLRRHGEHQDLWGIRTVAA